LTVSDAHIANVSMDKLHAGRISVAGGSVLIGHAVHGAASGIRVSQGGAIIVTDAAGNVVFNTGSIFQGGFVRMPWGIDGINVFGPANRPKLVWQPLDLSPWVGARTTFVLLQVWNHDAFTDNFVIRPRGTPVGRYTTVWANQHPGSHACRVIDIAGAPIGWNTVVGITDSAGWIEWVTSDGMWIEIRLYAFMH